MIFWLYYFLIGLCIIFSLLYLGSYFGVSFLVLINRGMFETQIVDSLFSPVWDSVVWGLSIAAISALVLYRINGRTIRVKYRLIADAVCFAVFGWVLLAVFGVVSLVSLVLVSFLLFVVCCFFSRVIFDLPWFALFVRSLLGGAFFVLLIEFLALVLFGFPLMLNLNPYGSEVAVHWHNVFLSLDNLFYPFLPYLYLGFVFLGIAAFLAKVFPFGVCFDRFKGGRLSRFVGLLAGLFSFPGDCEFGFLRSRLALISAIVASSVISVLFVVFTLLPWVNPTGILVSADAPVYYQWLDYMRSVDVNSALSFAFGNDRALFLILIYVLSFVASPMVVLQTVSALLIVVFGFLSFFVLRLISKVKAVWVMGVLLVPLSFQALGLIYSGYFANMLALILVLVYLLLLFRLLRCWSSVGFFGLLFVSIGVLFSHSWTWFIFALSLVLFLFLEWRTHVKYREELGRFKKMGVFVFVTIFVGLLCDFCRGLLGPVSSSSSVLSTAQTSLRLPDLGFVVSELDRAVGFVLGGVFASVLLVFLGVVGFVVLMRFRSSVSRFFVSWVFVGCVFILFAAQSLVFDRVLFLMPWVFLCSLGLFFVSSWIIRHVGRWRFVVFSVVFGLVFLDLLNRSLNYIFNILIGG